MIDNSPGLKMIAQGPPEEIISDIKMISKDFFVCNEGLDRIFGTCTIRFRSGNFHRMPLHIILPNIR